MTCKLIEPVFEEIAWTGDNLAAMVAYVETWVPSSTWTTQIIDEQSSGGDPEMVGALFLRSSPNVGLIALKVTEVVVYGPMRGASTINAGFTVMPAADYADQYTAV